jgi:peptide/nickel transport system permease protein
MTPPPDIGNFTQWQLIRLRFRKHKLAVVALHLLAGLYLLAALASFIAPYPAKHKNLSAILAPPQLLRWSPSAGLHVRALKSFRNPADQTMRYREAADLTVPVRLLAPSPAYRLWGIFPLRHKLFGVDERRLQSLPANVPRGVFLLGTDRYGRDLFSRILYGAQISLSLGLVAIAVSLGLGLAIGGAAGYFGGWFDLLSQRLMEILNAIPSLPLWIALGAMLPADWPPLRVYFGITIVLSLLGWTGLARTVRSKLLALREEDYATAARLAGASSARIIFRHLIPGFSSHIIVGLSLAVPTMILGESALSFLGLGLRPPMVSWGVMLQDCLNLSLLYRHPWLVTPTFFIIAAVLAFNFVGDGLRDAADPYR